MSRRDDRRSPEAAAYRKLYKTQRWQALRAAQIAKQPLCERCKANGRITPATVAHHTTPHKGDPSIFYDATTLASSCAPCHDGPEQSEERLGYSTEIDVSGWPVDEKHPANLA